MNRKLLILSIASLLSTSALAEPCHGRAGVCLNLLTIPAGKSTYAGTPVSEVQGRGAVAVSSPAKSRAAVIDTRDLERFGRA